MHRSLPSPAALIACLICLGPALGSPLLAEDARVTRPDDGTIVIENGFLRRVFSVEGGTVRTVEIVNKLDGAVLRPIRSPEFALRLSEGADRAEGDVLVDASGFAVEGIDSARVGGRAELVVALRAREIPMTAELRFTLGDDEPWLRKQVVIESERRIVLERIDVEAHELAEARQPYQIQKITAQAAAEWKPGLGQPLYTARTGTFWGIEFPAASNQVDGTLLRCGYLHGRQIGGGIAHASHLAVVGVGDDPRFIRDTFLDYIDRIRVRPLRLQVQYNSWFDFGGGVDRAKFGESVRRIHHELVEERGVEPLSAYVIDDGWQNTGADWSQRMWAVNGKFDPDFAASRAAVADAGSSLGLWMSPGCLFGAQGAIPAMKAAGFESIDPWMSMAGPRFMAKLEERMVELARDGVAYFKLDGLFGHYITRNFELHGARYGLPEMPQLTDGIDGLTGSDARLNDPVFDELKTYYLAAGAERLIELFRAMASANPDVYIVISNGAWLSPWWLQHVDSVWMINAGDAADGSTRTEELVYRDGRYHELWTAEQTQFPLCALFNHEPKKTSSREPKDAFRRYLYMSLSRGTGFVELYITPRALEAYDWDVLAEGLRWTRAVFPTFGRSRMHGGNPDRREVYGYTAWDEAQGYVSIHNPAAEPREYRFALDRAFGLHPGVVAAGTAFQVSSPLGGSTEGLPAEVRPGNEISLTLQPGEIRILNFTREPADWSGLIALQERTDADFDPSTLPSIKGHAVLGTWHYRHAGADYSREFTEEGVCILREGGKEVWRYPFTVETATEAIVAGNYVHRINEDGTMTIEGNYRARRR